MKSRKRILVCPLDWGLGHASRCIPVIRELIDSDLEVIIGADNGPLALLKRELPQLEFIEFPGYSVSYSKNGSMPLKMMLSSLRVFVEIYREHSLLKSIIKNYKIDAIISDNRFGLWSNTVPAVFITHQVMVKCPKHLKFLEPLIHRLNKFFIDKYDECWIPDLEGIENLSADLSHRYPLPKNAEFIGSLSRFDTNGLAINESDNPERSYDLMAIISGPEPQRSIFEKIVLKQLEGTSLKAIIVRGVPEENEKIQLTENLETISHLETNQMRAMMLSSGLILSRAGYSTIMDLAVLRKKAILVPTPGQTEQEYLAELFHQKGVFYRVSQEDFSSEGGLKCAIEKSAEFKGIDLTNDGLLLKKRVKGFIDKNKMINN